MVALIGRPAFGSAVESNSSIEERSSVRSNEFSIVRIGRRFSNVFVTFLFL